MPLETATFIADLVNTNPPTSDLETQGANHLQLIKTVLQNTLGTSVRRLVGLPTIQTKSANYSVVVADSNSTFLVNTAGGAVTLTLPTNLLAAADAGWEISIVKTTTDTNPIFLVPFSGTLQSGEYTGLTKVRRCLPGRRSKIFWTGSAIICERAITNPISSFIPYTASKTLPVGFEWPNGQVLSSAANYPEYFALVGSGNTIDMRGRAHFSQDDMGGVAANRITVAGGNFDGTILNNSGGLQNHTMTTGELVAHNHTGSGNVSDPGHTHTIVIGSISAAGSFAFNASNNSGQSETTSIVATGLTVPSLNINNTGGGNPFTTLPPGLTCPALLVVE